MLENVFLTITYPLLINVLNDNGLGLIWSFMTHDMPLAGTNKSVGYIYSYNIMSNPQIVL